MSRIASHPIGPKLAITPEHLQGAADHLGISRLYMTPGKQAFLLSTSDHLDRLAIHPNNRNIDPGWVRAMKEQVRNNAMTNELMILTAAIDIRQVHRIINRDDDDDDAVHDEFQGYILDGQHRYMAMRELRDEIPGFRCQFVLVVYLVESEVELLQRVEMLNRRREFTATDAEQTMARTMFRNAFLSLMGEGNENRQCVHAALKRCSERLRDDAVLAKLYGRSFDDIRAALRKLARGYEAAWQQKLAANPKNQKNMLGKVIQQTGMYVLAEDNANWLMEIERHM